MPMLCERCGYEIEGLEDQALCPECGRPLADSSPEITRPGSAWQRALSGRPSGVMRAMSLVPAAVVTLGAVVLNPPGTMRRVRIDADGMRLLTFANITIAAAVLASATHGAIREFVLDVWPSGLGSPAALFGPTLRPVFAVATLAMWFVLFVSLTRIERFGVRFFSKRRGWRVSATVALVVTAHASFLWIAAAGLAVLGPSVVAWLSDALPLSVSRYLIGTKVIAGPLGFVAGMTWFELTTFLGVRACRYANEPRGARGD